MAFVGISLPFYKLGRFWDNIGVRRIGQRRDTLSDILIGHFQIVATAARHLPSVFLSFASKRLSSTLAGALNGWKCCCKERGGGGGEVFSRLRS